MATIPSIVEITPITIIDNKASMEILTNKIDERSMISSIDDPTNLNIIDNPTNLDIIDNQTNANNIHQSTNTTYSYGHTNMVDIDEQVIFKAAANNIHEQLISFSSSDSCWASGNVAEPTKHIDELGVSKSYVPSNSNKLLFQNDPTAHTEKFIFKSNSTSALTATTICFVADTDTQTGSNNAGSFVADTETQTGSNNAGSFVADTETQTGANNTDGYVGSEHVDVAGHDENDNLEIVENGKNRHLKATKECSVILQIVLTAVFFLLELIVGYAFNSLALQVDAYHMLSDLISLIISYVAIKFGQRKIINARGKIPNTFGWVRADILGGLVNSVFLIAICMTIFIEAMSRFSDPSIISEPKIVLIVACAGFAINLIGLALFHNHAFGHGHHHHGHDHLHESHAVEKNSSVNPILDIQPRNSKYTLDNDIELPKMGRNDPLELISAESISQTLFPETVQQKNKIAKKSGSLNFQGIYMHVLGDLLGSIVVIIDTIVILLVKQDWTKYLDPTLSVISVIILLSGAIPIVKKSCSILIQMAPPGLDVSSLKDNLHNKFPDILGIHDFHIWLLTSDKIIASVHMLFKDHHDYKKNMEDIKLYFHQLNIHSLTIQPEYIDQTDTDSNQFIILDSNNCNVPCPTDDCKNKKCC